MKLRAYFLLSALAYSTQTNANFPSQFQKKPDFEPSRSSTISPDDNSSQVIPASEFFANETARKNRPSAPKVAPNQKQANQSVLQSNTVSSIRHNNAAVTQAALTEEDAERACVDYFQNERYTQALILCEAAGSVKSSAEAQYVMGAMYLQGLGTHPDYQTALKWFQKAAAQQHPGANLELGKAFAKGVAVPLDYKKSFDYFASAAKQGDAEAHFMMALCYQNGFGVPKNYERANQWYLKAHQFGYIPVDEANRNASTNTDLSNQDLAKGEKLYQKAMDVDAWNKQMQSVRLQYMLQAAAAKHPKALYQLGLYYFEGRFVSQNDAKAYDYFNQAALSGYKPAQSILAWMNALGLSVTEDNVQATNWYLQSNPISYQAAIQVNTQTAQSDAETSVQHPTKDLFLSGKNKVETEKESVKVREGLKWINEAANRDFTNAQLYLAELYKDGKKVPQNSRLAMDWYKKAAKLGSEDALRQISQLYYSGKGVPQNLIEAYAWLNLAATNGNESIVMQREEVAKSMTANQIREAQNRSLSLLDTLN